jgi:hypothetical protein
MFYITRRLHSIGQFDVEREPELWKELVSEIEEIEARIPTWKIQIVTHVSHPNDTRFLAYNTVQGWQQPEIVVQTAVCYLRVEQNLGQTTFTLTSPSESGLENLVALLENLYEPIVPASIESFLQRSGHLSVRSAEFLNTHTREKTQTQFTTLPSLDSLRSAFPLPHWSPLSISVIPEFADPLEVSLVYLRIQANQIWFDVKEEKEEGKIAMVDRLFNLAEITFRDEPMAMPAVLHS